MRSEPSKAQALRGRLTTPLAREAATYGASVLLTAAAVTKALQLWRADLRVPFTYWGDAVAIAAHSQTVLETGWYEYASRLGAPAGQHYHDFPTADNLNFLALRVIGLFTSSFGLAMNLYYLLGFIFAAVGAVWFLRQLPVSRTWAVPLSVLYAIAPYHFQRGEAHLWLSSYFVVPLALVVVLRAVRGEPLWGVRAGSWPWWVRALTGRGASTTVCMAMVVSANSYYGVFVVALLAVGGLASLIRTRAWRRFWGAAAAGVVLVAVLVLNMLPDVLYTRAHGSSASGFVRSASEVEIYALKIAQLVLPIPGHRIDALANIRQTYDSHYPGISENPSLGTAAAVGFVIALVVAVLAVLGARLRSEASRSVAPALVQLSGLITLAVLFATTGGFATFISFLTPALRGWNRMSIVIAMLSLGVVGLVGDAVVRAVAGRLPRWRTVVRWSTVPVVGLVLICGYLDQVTPGVLPDYPGTRAQYEADATWVGAVEAALPAGAMVFQYPHQGFPETSPVNGVWDTDQLKPFLHSTSLRWSGASIKGRASTDWGQLVTDEAPSDAAVDLAAAGFTGLLLDRQALGETADEVQSAFTSVLGQPLVVSADHRHVLYGLTGLAASLTSENGPAAVTARGVQVVRPVMAYPTRDVIVTPTEDGPQWSFPAGSTAVVLDNARSAAVTVRFSATVKPADGAAATVIQLPSGPLTVAAGAGFSTEFVVPPGHTTVTVVSGGAVDLVTPTLTEVGAVELAVP